MKKALDIIKSIFTWLVVILAVGMMIFTVISVNTFNRNDRSIFGLKAYIVLSDSMKATDFAAGDLVLIKEVDPSTLQAGDIISYQSVNAENYGETVTHKIRRLAEDADGNPGFVTYGTTTDTDDENIVTYSYVLGKYQMRLPGVGRFFQFLKTTPGYIVCIFLPFMILILMQGINSIRLFRAYKKEQQDALQEERDKIEAERAETQRMMAELMQMRAQMQGGSAAAPENTAESEKQTEVQSTAETEE